VDSRQTNDPRTHTETSRQDLIPDPRSLIPEMHAHVVMFRPPATLSDADREALLESMRVAFSNIDGIVRARIGRRTLIGRGYEALMKEHMEWLAILEFASEADLKTYLEHPAHEELARRFFQTAEAALIYDFEVVEAASVRDLLG